MFILINRDDFFGLEVICDCYSKPKQFTCESEAIDYANEKNLITFQVIEVTI